MKTILLFRFPVLQQRFDYQPLFDYARDKGWRIQTIEYVNSAVTRHWDGISAPSPNVKNMVAFWNPDGCIVECGGMPDEPWFDELAPLPTIFLDRPNVNLDCGCNSVTISSDSKGIAMIATKELLSLGLDDFAYAAYSEKRSWSLERGRFFADLIRQHGKRIRMFTVPKSKTYGGDSEILSGVLRSLPRPCGIFAANDETAMTLVNACDRLGFGIPEEFPLISVDNDEEICEHLPVPLTSIEQDYSSIGLVAANALDGLMTGKSIPATITFGVKRTVRRLSTLGATGIDRRLAVVVDFIRRHSSEDLALTDIAKNMNCSERQANRLFRKWRGHSPLDELHLQRIANAKDLLGNPGIQISTIAEICGYTSPTDFGRVFKRYVGMTPRAWRQTK